jgi:hypothetical protein
MTMANPTEMLQRVDGQVSNLREYFEQTRIERIRDQQRLAGIKWMEWAIPVPAPVGTSFTLQTASLIDSGFLLDLRVLSFRLSANDSVACFKADSAAAAAVKAPFGYGGPPGASPAQNFVTINLSKAVPWKGEPLFFTTSGTGNITAVYLTGWQVPAEEQGKLY